MLIIQQVGAIARKAHKVPPSACEGCGEQKRLQRHHPDYSRPVEIRWLCTRCHAKADKERRATEAQGPPIATCFEFRLTPEQRGLFSRAAKKGGRPVASWIRARLEKVAREELGKEGAA